MNPSLFFLKVKHFIKRDKRYYAEAISNYLGNGRFALFFDFDDKSDISKLRDIINYLSDDDYGVFETKHGYQFIVYLPFKLHELKTIFHNLKGIIKTDYFWSVPLWLRVSEKFNEEGIISYKPNLIMGTDKRNIFKLKKLYRTWD